MNQDQLDQFGKEDPVAQLTWLLERDRELKKLWKCSCGTQLPTKGLVWADRWDAFVRIYRAEDDDLPNTGYICDACVRARGMRIDH